MPNNTLVDLTKIYATSVGTGTIVLGAAVPSFRGIEGLTDGATYPYSIRQNANYEVGTGVYDQTTGTISRNVIYSSNGNAPLDLLSNAEIVFTALSTDYGQTGLSAYEIAVDHGFVGTEAEWVASLRVYASINVPYPTYAQLLTQVGMQEGDRASVIPDDTGTHNMVTGDVGFDGLPVTPGGQTPNAGLYEFDDNYGWVRIANTWDTEAKKWANIAMSIALNTGAAVAREPYETIALDALSYAPVVYQTSSSPANSAGTTGAFAIALDAGTDFSVVGAPIDALHAAISLAASATSLIVTVRERSTADALVNNAPPIAGDTTLSTMTITNLAALASYEGGAEGAAMNVPEKDVVIPLSVPYIRTAGKTIVIELDARDVSNAPVAINVGTRTVTATGRQRRNGWVRTTPGAAYGNRATTLIPSLGILTKNLTVTAITSKGVAVNNSAISSESQRAMTQMLVDNDILLAAQAIQVPTNISVPITIVGDSLMANANATAGNKMSDVAATFFTGSVPTNAAVGGTRLDQIFTSLAARSISEKAGIVLINGGTNDIGQNASGVTSATIINGGSGGVDGTYSIPTIGGSGTSLAQASYTATVSGGVLTALVPGSTIGGGFTAAPSFDFSSIPGLTGVVATPNLDVLESMKYWVGRIAAILTGQWCIWGPWISGGGPSANWARARALTAWQKATYGAKAFDALSMWVEWHTGSETSLASARTGAVPADITFDLLHLDDRSTQIGGRVMARQIIAMAGGAPFIHDEVVGIKAGASLGSAVLSPRVLGTATGVGWRITAGNSEDAARIASNGGAITRGAGIPAEITELYVQTGTIKKGMSNKARIVLMREDDGTAAGSITRLKGNGSSTWATPKLTGAVPTKKLTVALCVQINSVGTTTNSGIIGNLFAKSGKRFRFTPRTAANGLIVDLSSTIAPDPFYEFNWVFFGLDTSAAYAKLVTNELTAVSGTPTADALYASDLITTIGFTTGSPWTGDDIKMMWIAQDVIDITDPTKRALFYDPVTKLPLDLGASGTVGGVTPLLYLKGRAGEAVLGRNYGTGGSLYTAPYINRDNVGFLTIT